MAPLSRSGHGALTGGPDSFAVLTAVEALDLLFGERAREPFDARTNDPGGWPAGGLALRFAHRGL